jgi:hypothetical protein
MELKELMLVLDSCNGLGASEYIGILLPSSVEVRTTFRPLACTLGNPSPDNDSAHELIKMVGQSDRIRPTEFARPNWADYIDRFGSV